METPEPILCRPTQSDAPVADASQRALIDRQLEILGRMAEVGLQVALAVERQAQAEPNAAALQSIAMAYSRTSRAVRLTIMLQSRVLKDLQAFDAEDEGDARLLEPAYRHKARVENIVDRIAKAEHPRDEDEVDRLVVEAGERLDDEDLYGDVLGKPVGELVALICKDLGLCPDWAKLAEEAWARDEIQSGVEGSPFNRMNAARAPPFAAANGGEDPLADPGAKPGEERVGVGEGGLRSPFDRVSERPHTWSG